MRTRSTPLLLVGLAIAACSPAPVAPAGEVLGEGLLVHARP
ncbi:MAG: hypothetical protein JWM80_1539, partial [Cyanobacteria bacterium RYN_339]|nr:hypothetical protein [Cyanobacteria bacterium RYN_339]